MPSRYHPIEDGLWDDEKFDATSSLPEALFEERAFFGFLATNKRQRPSGIYRVTDEQLAAGSRLPVKRVKAYLISLSARSLIVRDGAWIFLPGYLKRQSKNDKLLIGVQIDIESCSSILILNAFAERYQLYSRWSADRLKTVGGRHPENRTLRTTSEPPQPILTSEPPPPQQDGLPTDPSSRWPSPISLAEKYNRETPDNVPSVSTLVGKRLEKAKAYLKLFPDESWWTQTFAQYQRSRFLLGKADPSNGHKRFSPDFDWLLSVGKDGVENCVKVHDGRYSDG
jgi:hypothetical protein